eukprot:Skav213568  [mRNA]  locus=scaffold3630:243873:244331:+ [translate_table: standard]
MHHRAVLEHENGKEDPTNPGFRDDFETGKAGIKDDDVGGFRPGAHVNHSRAWSYEILEQQLALTLLTEAEFTRVTKQTPQQAKRTPLHLSWSSMDSNEKFFTVHMKRMEMDDLLSCGEIRLKMADTMPV